MIFKVGDKVKFKHGTSSNARYFSKGLINLEIKAISGTLYIVWESDKSRSWNVRPEELEFNFTTWKERYKK